MNQLDQVESVYMRQGQPEFQPGDTVRVHVRVVEGDKQRIQVFQGVVIARRGGGTRETFTVRTISGGIGGERIFLVEKMRSHRPSALSQIGNAQRVAVAGQRGDLDRPVFFARGRDRSLRANECERRRRDQVIAIERPFAAEEMKKVLSSQIAAFWWV